MFNCGEEKEKNNEQTRLSRVSTEIELSPANDRDNENRQLTK